MRRSRCLWKTEFSGSFTHGLWATSALGLATDRGRYKGGLLGIGLPREPITVWYTPTKGLSVLGGLGMSRIHFSLGGLLAFTLFVCFICAALRYGTDLWTSAAVSLCLLLLLLGILAAMLRPAARPFWTGF